MFIAEIRFPLVPAPDTASDTSDTAERADYALGYLAPWSQSGRVISDDEPVYIADGSVVAVVRTPERDALTSSAAQAEVLEWVSDGLLDLEGHGLAEPTITILGPCALVPTVCECKSPSAYLLCTHYLAQSSPVDCWDCHGPIPLYRLPQGADGDLANYIGGWEESYQACDTLNMRCGVGERFGEGQMKRWDSPLMVHTREVAESITEATGKPTYVYLHRSHGAHRYKRHAVCPGCASPWTRTPDADDHFELRCHSCRIVAYDY